jgi:uncharacterized protein
VQALRDPIHRSIPLEPWAAELIDAREMQRLRRVRQLGTAYLVYPGANHSRFEHALGAHKLAQDASRIFGLGADDARPLQAAALLHDVGHGPMSHLFEEVDPRAATHHEEYGADLVRWSGLADRLRGAGIEPHRVAELVLGHGTHARLVSGDIDVDRMDYLVRDAHYTGLPVSVDPQRILQTLALREGDVVVRQEGVTAVEQLLLTRFLMYPAVYFHHTCRAAEAMIVAGIRRIVADGARLQDLRVLDDAQLLAALEAEGGLARDLALRVNERRLYKRAIEGTRAQLEADPALRAQLESPEGRARLEADLTDDAGLATGQVLLDVPRLPLVREVDARVELKSGRVVPLREASTLVRHLLAAQTDHWRYWVFAPKEAVDRVRDAYARRTEPSAHRADPKNVKPSPA